MTGVYVSKQNKKLHAVNGRIYEAPESGASDSCPQFCKIKIRYDKLPLSEGTVGENVR